MSGQDLQILDGEIADAFEQLEGKLKQVVEAATLVDKKKLEREAQPVIKSIRGQLSTLRTEFRKANASQKSLYEGKHKKYDARLKEIEKELRGQINPAKKVEPKKSYSEQHMEDMMGAGGADGSKFENADQVLTAAKNLNTDALASLKRSERLAIDSEAIGQDTLQTLQKQTELMYRIDAELENLQGELDRAGRDVKWFVRQMAGDKCFLSVFGIVILALLIVVFYSMYKKKRG